jgi:hypothetical protein
VWCGRAIAGLEVSMKTQKAPFVSEMWLPFRKTWQDLTRDKAASTFIRLNRSQHVVDLRLIFYATVIVVVAGIALAVCAREWMSQSGLGSSPALIAAIFGTGCGIIAWTYQRGSARLGIVDLFACEIATICRVTTIVGVAGSYADAYKNAPPKAPVPFNSEEHYTPVFDNNSKDLEVLEARVVEPVTEFYTYLKAMRDYLRLLSTIEHPDTEVEQWQTGLRGVVYMLFLMLESGRKAIDRLIEFQPERAQNIITILLSELVVYELLLKIFPADGGEKPVNDAQAKRLRLRTRGTDGYFEFIPALYRQVREHQNEEDWAKAAAMTAELERLYVKAFGKPIDGGSA